MGAWSSLREPEDMHGLWHSRGVARVSIVTPGWCEQCMLATGMGGATSQMGRVIQVIHARGAKGKWGWLVAHGDGL